MILAHLLRRCSSCTTQLRSFVRPKLPADAYDGVFERLERANLDASLDPGQLLSELDAQPESRHELLVRNCRRYWSAGVAELLRERSFNLRFDDPQKMLCSARLAVLIAEHLEPANPAEEAQLGDLRALCLSQFGTALRVSGKLDAADQSMRAAREWRRRGTGAADVRALINEQLASLRSAQSRFNESERLYALAAAIWRDLGKPHFLARVLVGRAIVVLYRGDPDGALSLLLDAIPRIDGASDPRLTLAACHAVVKCQIELGQVEEASLRWVELRSLYNRFEDPILRARGNWLEGSLMIAQGMIAAGLKLQQDAREMFAQKGLKYDAALVALDMAGGYGRLGKWGDQGRVLTEALPVLRTRELTARALASLASLKRAPK